MGVSDTDRAGILQRASASPGDTLPPALAGTLRSTTGRSGRLGYYVAGQGSPLLLVHSINAAGSAYEMRPLFERMQSTHRVYALDLPGFGFSDRSARNYDIALYVDAIHDLLDVMRADAPDTPADVVALSLSCEYAARAAVQRPERVRTLSLITPTGFSRGSNKLRAPAGKSREVPGLYKLFSLPAWSQGLYDLLASRKSIRYFLQRTYGSKQIHEDLFEYGYLSSHQPGARHAPIAFLSRRLFSADIRDVYECLTMPVWVPHGTRGDFKDFSDADWTRSRPSWRIEPFSTGALVQYEAPDQFASRLEMFLREPAAVPAA